jgi:hypothetical protein
MEHDKQSSWERNRPQTGRQRLYLILGILAIVVIIGSMCFYLVPLLNPDDGDTTSMLLQTAVLLPRT